MNLFNEKTAKMASENYSNRKVSSRDLGTKPLSTTELSKILLMHPAYNQFIKDETAKIAKELEKNKDALAGLEELIKRNSVEKIPETDTEENTRFLPALLGVAVGGVAVGAAAAGIKEWVKSW